MSSNRIWRSGQTTECSQSIYSMCSKNQGIDVKSHMSTVDDATANIILEKFQKKPKVKARKTKGNLSRRKNRNANIYTSAKRQRGKPERPRMPERFQYQGERQQREEDIEAQEISDSIRISKIARFAKKTEAFRTEERSDRGQRPEVTPRDRGQRPEVTPRDRGQRPEVAPRDRGQRPEVTPRDRGQRPGSYAERPGTTT